MTSVQFFRALTAIQLCFVITTKGQSIKSIPPAFKKRNETELFKTRPELQLYKDDSYELQNDSILQQQAIGIIMLNKNENLPSADTFNELVSRSFDSLKNLWMHHPDYLKKEYNRKSYTTTATANLAKLLNGTSTVELLATGGISNLQDAKSMNGNLGIGLQVRVSDFKAKKNGWVDPHYIYVMFNAKTATSADSGVLQKEILFPEISKRDFVLGYFFRWMKNDFCIDPTVEFALNKYSDSAHVFRTESITLGVGLSKAFSISANSLTTSVSLRFFPYYNVINIDPKYWTDYNAMLKDPSNAHATFHTLGLQTFLQIDKVVLFCNAKYVLNKMENLQTQNRDFIRFVYTIGTMVAL